MKGFFCSTKVRTNEEYKAVIKYRMKLFVGIGLLGAVTMLIGFLVEFFWKVSIDDRMLGLYTGFGTGLLLISIIFWVINKRLLGNEEKLKKSRISNTDERLKEISTRSLGMATTVLLVTVYGMILIGGLFFPMIVAPLIILITVFVTAYVAAYLYYKRKM
jgi:hypothetical protein